MKTAINCKMSLISEHLRPRNSDIKPVNMSAGYHIGQRVSYNSAICTVRYQGLVAGTKGEWLGVEWDDPTRGKHNGARDGVIYFDCM